MPEFGIVKAIILSGGVGTRLRPITEYIPKPLVPLCNIPIIEWQIRYFKKFGIKELVVSSGYLSKQIVDYLKIKNFEVDIKHSVENSPLGTGGALKKATKYLDDENFFVLNGDVITNIDLKKMMIYQNSLAVVPLRTTYGVVHVENEQVKQFKEKPEIEGYWMNAGLYYLNKEIVKYLPNKGNIENTVFPLLSKMRKLHAIKFTDVFWQSIDSHKDMEDCISGMKHVDYENFVSTK